MMIEHLRSLREKLGSPDWTAMLSNLAHCLPEDVWLRGLQLDQAGKMSISGSALEENNVYEFMRWIDQAPDWDRVVLVSTRPNRYQLMQAVDFEVECQYCGHRSGTMNE
jgi:Tfp pilus assembly protein PilN